MQLRNENISTMNDSSLLRFKFLTYFLLIQLSTSENAIRNELSF